MPLALSLVFLMLQLDHAGLILHFAKNTKTNMLDMFYFSKNAKCTSRFSDLKLQCAGAFTKSLLINLRQFVESYKICNLDLVCAYDKMLFPRKHIKANFNTDRFHWSISYRVGKWYILPGSVSYHSVSQQYEKSVTMNYLGCFN